MSDRLLDVSETGLVPLFALPEVCLLPGESLPFFIFEPRYRQMLKDTLSGERLIALARLKPGYEADYNGNPPVFPCMGSARSWRTALRATEPPRSCCEAWRAPVSPKS